MSIFKRLIGRPVTTEAFDDRVAQWAAYAGGPAIFALSVLKLTSLNITEYQLVVGLLLASLVAGLFILTGQTFGILESMRQMREACPGKADAPDRDEPTEP